MNKYTLGFAAATFGCAVVSGAAMILQAPNITKYAMKGTAILTGITAVSAFPREIYHISIENELSNEKE